jgi:quercetin dioxygenase-like cupin family protein
MKRIQHLSLLAVVAVSAAVALGAREEKETDVARSGEDIFVDAQAITWGDPPPRLPRGCRAALLVGDPTKKGWFTTRLHAPAGYRIPAHTHTTAEHVTVISGSVHLGSGRDGEESSARLLKAGDYAVLAPGSRHAAWFTEDAVIQIQAEGPFDMEYVNAADDPRSGKK